MRFLNIILAATKEGYIGHNNTLPWKLKGDLKRFKSITENNCIIMGKNTFASLGYKTLPNRTNIVVSSTLNPKQYPDAVIVDSITKAIAYGLNHTPNELFLVGGVPIFDYGFKHANRIYLTDVLEYPSLKYDAVISDFAKKLSGFSCQSVESSGHSSHLYKTYTRAY